MSVIDIEWLKTQLEPRGQKARLAEFLDIPTTDVSKILSKVRAIQSEEGPKILEFLGDPLYSRQKQEFDEYWAKATQEERDHLLSAARLSVARGREED